MSSHAAPVAAGPLIGHISSPGSADCMQLAAKRLTREHPDSLNQPLGMISYFYNAPHDSSGHYSLRTDGLAPVGYVEPGKVQSGEVAWVSGPGGQHTFGEMLGSSHSQRKARSHPPSWFLMGSGQGFPVLPSLSDSTSQLRSQ